MATAPKKGRFVSGPYGHGHPKGKGGGAFAGNTAGPAPPRPSGKKGVKDKNTPLWERDAISFDPGKQSQQKHIDLGDKLMKDFRLVRRIMMTTGQLPFYFVKVDGVWKVGWFYNKWNMIWFKIVGICGILSLFVVLTNVVTIMSRGRYYPKELTDGQIIVQALLERHSQFMMHIIAYLFLAAYWSCLLMYRKKLWLKVLNGIWHFTWETGIDFSKINNREVLPFCVLYGVTVVNLWVISMILPSPQTVGCPTLLTYSLFNWLIPDEIFDAGYPTSSNYWLLHITGIFLFVIIHLLAHVPLLLYFWSMAVIKSAWSSWNQRMHFYVCRGEENSSAKERTTYELMYWDVNRLLEMTIDMDELWSLLYESYLLLLTILLCFENGFTIKVLAEGDEPLHQNDWGRRFIRPKDYLSSVVLAPFNAVTLTLIIFAASWATDAAGSGYDIMRRKAFIDGLNTGNQVSFTTGLIQMYSLLRKIGFEFGRYVEVSRSNYLVLCNLVISTSILVFQLNLQNDMLTLNWPRAFNLIKDFLINLEGLDKDHGDMRWKSREDK